MVPRGQPGAEFAHAEMIMGLPVSIHLREASRSNRCGEFVAEAVDAAFAQMRRFDLIFSPYRSDSTLTAVRGGHLRIDRAGPEFAEMLHRAEEAKRLTGGAFDVHFGGSLDPSGLVKGWAAERAGAVLAGLGLDWYLNAGGDITCGATTRRWRIGIEHPADPSGLITVVELDNGGLATSGTAHRGAHIIDPLTATPAAGIGQVTVLGPSLARADIWATAIAARGQAALTSPADPLLPACVADGYQVFAVADNGTVHTTDGFAPFQVGEQPRPHGAPFAALA